MVKKEIAALGVWALMIILLLGLFLISPKSNVTGGITGIKSDGCMKQVEAHCMKKNYGSMQYTLTDTNLCTGQLDTATLYSSGKSRKFVFASGDTVYNSESYVCVVCTDGRTKAFNKNSGKHCSTF